MPTERPTHLRILGIDPGSRITGYGLVDVRTQPCFVAGGCIRTSTEVFSDRLRQIFTGVADIVADYSPDVVAIESTFMHRNADTALKLGQARAAALCGTMSMQLPVFEYAPREVKLAVVGRGGADKRQVQHMVKVLLKIDGAVQADAADALAVALCHAHGAALRGRLQRLGGGKV